MNIFKSKKLIRSKKTNFTFFVTYYEYSFGVNISEFLIEKMDRPRSDESDSINLIVGL